MSQQQNVRRFTFMRRRKHWNEFSRFERLWVGTTFQNQLDFGLVGGGPHPENRSL